MARKILSGKHLQIDKANSTIVIFVAVSAFVTVFSLVACKALVSQLSYQNRVITEKNKALKQLKENNENAKKLVETYKAFAAEPINIIGGSASGSGDRDGDNARIALDALPSKYDFPALTTSIDKVITPTTVTINTITGIDDELLQSKNIDSSKAVDIPFVLTMTGTFDTCQSVLDVFHRSIRPIYITKIGLTGSDNSLEISISAKSNYQPEKTVTITTKDVK